MTLIRTGYPIFGIARILLDEEEEVCGLTFEHDIDHEEYCEEDGRTYWHCRRCDAEGFDEPPAEPAGPTARAEARADRHERLGAGAGVGRVEGVDR